MKKNGRIAALTLTVLLASSCQMISDQSSGRFGDDAARSRRTAQSMSFGDDAAAVRPGAMQRGTDSFLNEEALAERAPSQAVIVPTSGGEVEMSLVNASIESAAHAVLGEALGLNYVVSDKVEGTVTIQTTAPVQKSVLLDLFRAALSANGAELRNEGGAIQIVPGSSGNSTYGLAGHSNAGTPIIVAPLKFVSAAEMSNLLAPLTQDGLSITADKKRNILLLSGPPEQREAALDALNLFDVDVLAGKSLALVQLDSADPDAVVEELNHIFESEEDGMLNGVVEFIPNRRLSSILVVTSRAQYLAKAERWIHQLDTSATSASTYMATYPLQNRSATEVAPILNELLNGSSATDDAQSTDAEKAALEGDSASSGIRVAADDSRNVLIVRAKRSDQQQVKAILAELDSAPKQVLLEATIAEVSLSNDLNLGTRWFFESGNWGFKFSDLESGAVAANNTSFAGIFKAGGAELAISALQGVTDVKIISAPTLMVLDNKEGVLQIGDQVPIATQTTSSDTANAPVLTHIEYRDTGVILRVKPRIGNGGRVILDIVQEVSNVKQTKTSGIDSPTISQRKIQTSVALGDGQTLALGGLVQEGDTTAKTETPGLSKVPVVGNLFRSKDTKKSRSELLIMIRPRVVNDDQDAAQTTSYWRSKLSGANSLLGNGLGKPNHKIEWLVE